MRAVAADVEASVTRDGVTVHYARYGDGSPTLVLLPTWSLVHSRHWKMQVPFLARHYTVLTFDGRGSGRSDRPASPASYGAAEFAADALAVMDATETERAVLVSVSRGALWSLHLCAEHPNRVLGAIFIAPGVPFAPPPLERAVVLQRFDEVVEEPVGWEKYNAHHWKADYRDFVEFFVGQMFTEEHSTKQYEDAVHWALETDPATLIATNYGLDECTPASDRSTRCDGPVSGAGDPGVRRRPPRPCRGCVPGRTHLRGPRNARGVRALPAHPRPCPAQPADPAVRRGDPAMRARQPDRTDVVERDGVKVAYEVAGAGEPGLLLIPSAPISHARSWKGLVPFLSRHFTVVTADPRGNGRSGRPAGRAAYGPAEMLSDQLAILDAVDLTRAVVVAHCHAVPWALRLAADHADRVSGVVAIAPAIALAPLDEHWAEPTERWTDEVDNPTGWGLCNRHFWRQEATPPGRGSSSTNYCREPHSTKQYEDAVSWALETDPETMIAEREGRDAPNDRHAAEALCRAFGVPPSSSTAPRTSANRWRGASDWRS